METRANYALIGLFTLAVFAGMLGFVYWFSAGRSSSQKVSYRVIFTGSVSGLNRGSVVRFNGLRVGEVSAIDLVPNDPSRVMAIIEIDQKTPVKTDTRARLEYQGLTGQASVQMSGGTGGAPALVAPDGGRAVIYADRSDFQDILETAQRLATRTDAILAKVEKIVADNESSIGGTVKSIETFAKALADNSAGVGAFLSSVGETSQRISSLSGRLETLSTAAEDILRGLNTGSVNRTITSQKLDSAFTEIDRIAKALDSQKIGRAVDNIDRITTVFGNNTAATDKALQDIAAISATLRVASEKVDGVLVAASRFLGSNEGEGKSAFAEVGSAARSFRDLVENVNGRAADFTEMAKSIEKLARSLDRRTQEITAGINRLTSSGGRDVEALAADARRAVNEVNRAVRSISRDPSQIITGGKPSVPEYAGQR
jgi:phospholipid/cholesterol/gamma-HCH transport system substrate-binding protein